MSSVNSSDSSNRNDDVVRRNREEYKQKESELVKKHQKEVRRLNEAHYSEVENIKDIHTGQMGEYQRKSKDNLSRRDMKYQKEIDNLRALHRRQLTDLHNETQMKLGSTEKSSHQEVELAKNQFNERSADMSETHQREMKEKEAAFLSSIEDLRQEQKQAIEGNRERLNEKYTKEIKIMSDGSSGDKADLSRQFRNYRQNAEARLKQQQMQHMQDKHRISDNLMGTIQDERLAQEESKANLRDGFKDSLDDIKEKYDEKRQEDLKYSALSRESLSSGVHGRINNKVRSLENNVRELEAKNVRDRVTREQRKQREIKNAKDAYQANVDDYKNQKNQLLEEMNSEGGKEIQELQSEHSKLMQSTTRQYLNRMNTQNVKNKEAITTLANDFEARQAQTSNQADMRVKNVMETTGEDRQRLTKNYQNNFEILRQQQAEEVKALQLKHVLAKAEATELLKQQMRERESQHQEKLNLLKNKYEKQIAELNDKRTFEKRSSDEVLKRQAEELKRAHHMELETQQVQFRDKVAKVQLQHDEEMKIVNSRHQEQIDQLVGALRKS